MRTEWALPSGTVELLDFMHLPVKDRSAKRAGSQAVVRRLRGIEGAVPCRNELWPRRNFEDDLEWDQKRGSGGVFLSGGSLDLFYWSSLARGAAGGAEFTVESGETHWFLFGTGEAQSWDPSSLDALLAETEQYWRDWTQKIRYRGPRKASIVRTAQTIHLLSYAPTGSIVAAPTTSLPERIGGDWNADYRFAWVRDASLSLETLLRLGNRADTRRYLDWLTGLESSTELPLQVVYGIRGEMKLPQRDWAGVSGYRNSPPVRVGNRAFHQVQLDSLGYLVDCAWEYLNAGGEWRDAFWDLVRRAARFTCENWRRDDHSIWELPEKAQYVSSKVMSWVTLDRSIRMAERLNKPQDLAAWRAERSNIHAQVLELGWSERRGAFRQRYESEALDAAVLLIPLTGFLPPQDPRVLSTIDQIMRHLTVDGLVYRFVPDETPGLAGALFGQYEGAFLPCSFFLASACALADKPEEAERIITRAESIAGPCGLFAEAVDPRTNTFLGNHPLLFSQIEYARAVMHLDDCRRRLAKSRASAVKPGGPVARGDGSIPRPPRPTRRSPRKP